MVAYLLNICADAPDLGSTRAAENLAYNDMESVLEIILEHALQMENAIPEHNDADNEHPEHTQALKLLFFVHEYLHATFAACSPLMQRKNFLPACIHHLSVLAERESPPPEKG